METKTKAGKNQPEAHHKVNHFSLDIQVCDFNLAGAVTVTITVEKTEKEEAMIDNVTGHFNDRKAIENSVFKDDSRNPIAKVGYNDGDIKNKLVNIENITIKATQKYTEIQGSLHSYFNAKNGLGAINYNDFPFIHIQEAICMLEEEIRYPASLINLTNYEFGFNLETKCTPSQLIDLITMFKYLPPCENFRERKKWYKQFRHENFLLKAYDKGLQFGLDKNLLRLEIGYRSKDLFNKFGVITLDDLRNKDCYRLMFDDFIERFDKDLMIIDDYSSLEKVGNARHIAMYVYNNPLFWSDLKNCTKTNEVNNQKKNMKNVMNKYELETTKKYIRDLLYEKFYTLLDS